jgi:hypothetical protein
MSGFVFKKLIFKNDLIELAHHVEQLQAGIQALP